MQLAWLICLLSPKNYIVNYYNAQLIIVLL